MALKVLEVDLVILKTLGVLELCYCDHGKVLTLFVEFIPRNIEVFFS